MAGSSNSKQQTFFILQISLTVLAAAGYIFLRVYWIRHRYFMVDETEHLHAAWCLARGQMIYKDFFEHHGPIIYWVIQPVARFFHDPIQALYAGRLYMQLLWLAILGLYLAIGKKDWSWQEKAVSVFVLCSFTTFARHTFEMRPDMPATLLLGLLYVLGLRAPSRLTEVAIGACLTAGLLSSPKFLFPAAGLIIGWFWYHYRAATRPLGQWFKGIAAVAAGGAVPLLITALWLHRNGALHDFIHWFFVFNGQNKGHIQPPWPDVIWLPIKENLVFWALALWGWSENRREGPLSFAFVGGLLNMLSGNALMLHAYFLLMAPIMAYFASAKLISLLRAGRENNTIVAIFFMGLLASYFIQTHNVLRNDQQINYIHGLQQRTKPQDRVMSFQTSEAVFRPHASYYWWITPDIEETLGRPWLERQFLGDLSDPACAAVIWEDDFLKNYPALQDYIRRHYTFAGGRLWLRNQPDSKFL